MWREKFGDRSIWCGSSWFPQKNTFIDPYQTYIMEQYICAHVNTTLAWRLYLYNFYSTTCIGETYTKIWHWHFIIKLLIIIQHLVLWGDDASIQISKIFHHYTVAWQCDKKIHNMRLLYMLRPLIGTQHNDWQLSIKTHKNTILCHKQRIYKYMQSLRFLSPKILQ